MSDESKPDTLYPYVCLSCRAAVDSSARDATQCACGGELARAAGHPGPAWEIAKEDLHLKGKAQHLEALFHEGLPNIHDIIAILKKVFPLDSVREALEWYGEQAEALQRAMPDGKDGKTVNLAAMEAIMVTLSLDAGTRAKDALEKVLTQ